MRERKSLVKKMPYDVQTTQDDLCALERDGWKLSGFVVLSEKVEWTFERETR